MAARPEKEVLLAWDRKTERQVALTVLDKRYGAARHESAILEQLRDHRHIVTVYETLETTDSIVLVSRYYAGGNLLREMEAGQLTIPRVLEIAVDICSGLVAVHRAGVVHSDLKPSNVVLGPRGEAVLADFGLARHTRDLVSAATTVRGEGNGFGALLAGTPAYMAPEVVAGSSPDARSDLYSLGCLVFELLTGHPPFVSSDANEVLRRQLSAAPPSLREARPDAPRLLDAILARLLDKDPAKRPASAQDVGAAFEGAFFAVVSSPFATRIGPLPPPDAQKHLDFASKGIVGRGRELAAIDRVVSAVTNGGSAALTLVGEPGIGKSRLLQAFVSRATSRGIVLLVGEGIEGPANLGSALTALRPLSAWLGCLPADDADVLRRFLDLRPPTPLASEQAERDRERISRAVFRALDVISREYPVAIVFEDLHWMDSGTVDLLEDIALRLAREPHPVALVGSTRPPEPASPLSGVLARLTDNPLATVLNVGPLSPADVDEDLRLLGVGAPSGALVSSLHQASHGNPLFLHEIIDRLSSAGELEQVSLSLSAQVLVEAAVPDSFAGAVTSRLTKVGHEAREVIAISAVLGDRLRAEVLAPLLRWPVEKVFHALEEGVAAGLLTRDAASGFRFAHQLIRSTVLSLTPPDHRCELHLRIAQWLADDGDGEATTRLLKRAHHLLRAGSLSDPREVVSIARLAGMRALDGFACQEAAALFESALEIATANGLLHRREEGDLHRLAGLAHFYRFDRAACVSHYGAAVEAFEAANDPIGLAQALNDQIRTDVMFGQRGYGVLGDVGPLEAALQRVPETEVALRARILGTLAEAYWGGVRPDEAVSLAERGLAAARAIGDDNLCVEINTQLAIGLLQSLRLEEALAAWQDGLTRARRTRNLYGEEQCLQRLPLVLYMMGRLDEAVEAAHGARALNATVRSAGDSSWPMAVLAAVSALRGDMAEAIRYGEETLEIVRRYRYPWSGAFALTTLAAARAAQGDWRGAEEAIHRTIQPGYLLEDPGAFEMTARQHLLLVRLWGGERLPADRPIDCPTPPTEDIGFDIAFIPSLCAQVEIALALGRADLLPGVARALARARDRGVLVSIAWPHLLPRIQGLVERAEGRLERGEAFLEEARHIAHTLRAEPEAARTAFDHAELLLARDGDGDRAHAHALLRQAQTMIRRHLPTSMRERAERALAFLGPG